MKTIIQWHAQTLGEKACEALKKNGFAAQYAETGAEALLLIEKMLVPGMSVGLGGSMTVKEIGVNSRLESVGVRILDHAKAHLSPEQKLEVMRAQLTCDLFISSSNAVTLEGEIFNIDGNGNRVGALTFGPKKTVVVVGVNKLVRNLAEAQTRAELTASPLNNKRLGRNNPCVKTGVCADCQGPERICRIYSVLKRKPSYSDFTVIIVGETLGF